MTKQDFKLLQQLSGYTNGEVALSLKVSEVLVEKWRAGTRTISAEQAKQWLKISKPEIKKKLRRFKVIEERYS